MHGYMTSTATAMTHRTHANEAAGAMGQPQLRRAGISTVKAASLLRVQPGAVGLDSFQIDSSSAC